MEKKFYQTKKFLKTKNVWYKKLKKSGFIDHEQDENYLIQNSVNFTHNEPSWSNPLVIKAKLEYYGMVRQFVQTYGFKNKKEKLIMELHADGLGVRRIAEELKVSKSKIHLMIKKLVTIMRSK